jgi:hypothetical protein
MLALARAALALAVALLCAATRSPAAEVQAHGLAFERWVLDTFFDSYRPTGYTLKWDIPAEANRLADPALAGLPVNPKATKLGAPVGLGDALRQHDIDEPFILILGYWEQVSAGEKRFGQIIAPRVDPQTWRKLWGDITRADLERLDAVIKDRARTPAEARRAAQAMKSRPPFSEAVIVLNPKIDSKNQRRLQCSLRYADVLKYLAPDAPREIDRANPPSLWGKPFSQAITSKPREFPSPPARGDTPVAAPADPR